ncbi:hypothetical protein BD626DRAFT_572275 [Schizophyllum amplum]|uniref:NmrA-like domain-containing protein n=1 Tax=Schizophyllum amplum TaxID=97359 RepID=A0A550C516_9AGAR|nr:hypothetical protein BD626DRAFT_572275 [Auriculariopsis ampla]
MPQQIITVFGATGKQGGSVVASILGDAVASAKFSVRAVTRDTAKDSSKALAAKGVEVVSADMNDKESLRKAIKGSYGVFLVTNFWEVFKPETEIAQGKNVADMCKHFDSKATVEEYVRELGIPATFFMAGFYMSNIPGEMMRRSPEGKWTLALPVPDDTPIPLFPAECDTGKFVKAIFLKRDTLLGKRVYGATAYTTPLEIVDGFKKMYPVTGKNAEYKRLSDQDYKDLLGTQGTPEPFQEELLQNMKLLYMFGYYGGDSLDFSTSVSRRRATHDVGGVYQGHTAFADAL